MATSVYGASDDLIDAPDALEEFDVDALPGGLAFYAATAFSLGHIVTLQDNDGDMHVGSLPEPSRHVARRRTHTTSASSCCKRYAIMTPPDTEPAPASTDSP